MYTQIDVEELWPLVCLVLIYVRSKRFENIHSDFM